MTKHLLQLRQWHEDYLVFAKERFVEDTKVFVDAHLASEKKIDDAFLASAYETYHRPSFFTFLQKVKTILYSTGLADFIHTYSSEWSEFYIYLLFLQEKKIIEISKDGQVTPLHKWMLDMFPRPQSVEEITARLEHVLQVKVEPKRPVTDLFSETKGLEKFEHRADLDQLPVSQESAIFEVQKILERIPLHQTFLFVGDDDFISLVLGIADPNVESLVVDADENLLSFIAAAADHFHLKVKTKKIDVQSPKKLKGEFVGFLCNPIYTPGGVETFIQYGAKQLGENGGNVFLVVGGDTIGNRYLRLQKFFALQNLLLEERLQGKIFYPHLVLYKDDSLILDKLSKVIDKKALETTPQLGASLCVFEYIPVSTEVSVETLEMYAYI